MTTKVKNVKVKKNVGMKHYTCDEIQKAFNRLTRLEKIDCLFEALDFMQQYNGRSRIKCIALAMGYDNIEGDDYSYFKVVE